MNLKLVFWKIARFSNSASSSGFRPSKAGEHLGIKKLNKINKLSARGAFKSLQVERWPSHLKEEQGSAAIQSKTASNADPVPFEYLTLSYLMREKKQKSKLSCLIL